MKRRRWLFVAGGFALLALLVVGVGAIAPRAVDDPAPPAAAPVNTALTVATVRAAAVRWPRSVSTSGSIAAWQEAVVSAEVGGVRLAEVLVDVGDQVHRGQLLAHFDAATVRADLAQQRALVSETEANLAEARSNAERAERLRDSGNISEQDLSAIRTRVRAAEAQLLSARARYESQALTVQYTKVLAPDDGVISSRSAMLGAVPGVGTELFRLVRQNRLEWHAELTSSQIAQVAPGMAVTVELPDGSSVAGRVRQLAPTLDSSTRTGIAYVDLEQPGSARPGMYAAGTVTLGQVPGLAVPSSAVVFRDGREYVFVVMPDQLAVLTAVQTGRRHGNQVEILSGVTADQDLVSRGGTFLNDGDRVRITTEDASS